jgi:transposase-like protein
MCTRNDYFILGSATSDRQVTTRGQAFFRKAIAINRSRWPRKVNLDGNAASHRALRLLGDEDPRWKPVSVSRRRYLNNIVEQDHRAIKRRRAPMLGLKSFETAAVTLAGVPPILRGSPEHFAR